MAHCLGKKWTKNYCNCSLLFKLLLKMCSHTYCSRHRVVSIPVWELVASDSFTDTFQFLAFVVYSRTLHCKVRLLSCYVVCLSLKIAKYLTFSVTNLISKFEVVPRLGAQARVGCMVFNFVCGAISRKRCMTETRSQLITNIKSHAAFRFVQK